MNQVYSIFLDLVRGLGLPDRSEDISLVAIGALLLIGFILKRLARGRYRPGRSLPQPFEIYDAFVIDGDTLAKNDLRIRIWGIDAPEKGQRQGQVARKHMIDMVANRNLMIHPRDIDRYGRLVAQVFVGDKDVGESMVDDGYAVACTTFTRKYARPERRARRTRAGLWRYGAIQDPTRYRRKHG